MPVHLTFSFSVHISLTCLNIHPRNTAFKRARLCVSQIYFTLVQSALKPLTEQLHISQLRLKMTQNYMQEKVRFTPPSLFNTKVCKISLFLSSFLIAFSLSALIRALTPPSANW